MQQTWHSLQALSVSLHLHRESPGSSGWGQVGAERFKSLDCLLSEASGNSHTRETSRHAEKTDNLCSEDHSSGCFSEVLCTKRKGQDRRYFKSSIGKKNSCSSGYKAAPSGRHRQTLECCPASCLPHSTAQQRAGGGTRLPVMCSSPPCAGLLFARAMGPLPESTATHRGTAAQFLEKE